MSRTEPLPGPTAVAGNRRTLKVVVAGLGTRLVGACLIWMGDGHASPLHKGLVVVGVILSVGGIAVLKFLLMRGLSRTRRRVTQK